jgi:hypothetical protein
MEFRNIAPQSNITKNHPKYFPTMGIRRPMPKAHWLMRKMGGV